MIGGLVAAAGAILSTLSTEVVAGGSVVIGILIGLLLYRSILAWKAAAAREAKEESARTTEKAEEKKADEKEEEYYPTDTYRSYGA